ncbi:autophagy-related protein 8C-like [Pyrus ussuriensis x Pyrus communis]|uniref:Autophagy-related protein 8C-like n=1 Tax=Pyrus ussuriensis x Pyrus communis TaxID=2448454 RepID=A0A5N5GXI8_9ROSA|nr:autophagy-related protein 8C-like [Pyrus ussuriensis x Pyrus communis]
MIVPFSSMPLKQVKNSVKQEREKTQVGSVQMASWFGGHVECSRGFKESNPFHDQDEVTVEKAAGSDMPDIDMKKCLDACNQQQQQQQSLFPLSGKIRTQMDFFTSFVRI